MISGSDDEIYIALPQSVQPVTDLLVLTLPSAAGEISCDDECPVPVSFRDRSNGVKKRRVLAPLLIQMDVRDYDQRFAPSMSFSK